MPISAIFKKFLLFVFYPPLTVNMYMFTEANISPGITLDTNSIQTNNFCSMLEEALFLNLAKNIQALRY